MLDNLRGASVPPEARRPVAWIFSAGIIGILLQILTATFIFGGRLARIEATKADRSEMTALALNHERDRTDLAKWQGCVDGKLEALLASMQRIEADRRR